MTARRVVALLVAATAALLLPAFAHASPAPAGQAPQPQGQGSLSVSPDTGQSDTSFTARYADSGQSCGSAFQVALTWDGAAYAAHRASPSCTAFWSALVPPRGSAPGVHYIAGELLDCSSRCSPVSGSQAAATYTVVAADPQPTAPPPTETPPPGAPATDTPRPTPTPTPLGLAPAGSFPPYACRNGIPDSTPCPSPTGAVAALATGPDTSVAPQAASSGDPVSIPLRTVGFVVTALVAVLVAVLALGWRQGAARRRQRGDGAPPLPR